MTELLNCMKENTTNYPSQYDMVDQIVDDMQVWDHEDLLTWAQGARRAMLLDVGNDVLRVIYHDCVLGDN